MRVYVASGEYSSSRNGESAWTVGVFADSARAAAVKACRDDALASSREGDIVLLPGPEAHAFKVEGGRVWRLKDEETDDWALSYEITSHDVDAGGA